MRAPRLRAPTVQGAVTATAVAAAVAFLFAQLRPDLLFSSTTPAGGDMGAHVWAPAYLRDHLLPDLRLAGWTPDWYAGFPAYHFYMVVPALLIVALDAVPLVPYEVAFKLVSVSGILTLPVAAWAFGRLSGMRFPGPALLAAATLPFLFDRSFTIYGGNIPSTLAGEFSFSISLSLALVYLGVLARGVRTGRHRALAAVLLALVGLSHVIPALFALGGTVAVLAVWPSRRALRHAGAVVPVAGLLGAFWALPFWLRRGYMTDMGWEKLTTFGDSLAPDDMRWALALAVAGAIAAAGLRRRPAGVIALTGAIFAVAFVVLPQGRLWNARLLPFWYLSVYFMAAVAVSEVTQALATLVARDPRRPPAAFALAAPVVAVAAAIGFVGRTTGVRWLDVEPVASDRSFVPDWIAWNYSGYEAKQAWPEYRGLMATMDAVGERQGCGRAMWEHDARPEGHDRYGTPMALMLLPYWTGGCIGSMEGLYFESSATTPFHFLNQSELSQHPSNPQRGLPYQGFDIDRGVGHLQMLGVRYYLAVSDEAKRAAAAHPDLERVATSGPWEVYLVSGSELVASLDHEPVVVTGTSTTGEPWQDLAVDFYTDPGAWDVPVAASGPDRWARVRAGEPAPREPVDPAVVRDVRATTDSISFEVDRPGSPVLVRASYFPNWEASGAEGPYRVTPNLMVVVPTDTQVTLRYGWTGVELLAWGLTLAGLVALGLLVRHDLYHAAVDALRRRPLTAAPSDDDGTPAREPVAAAPGRPGTAGPSG